MKTIDDVVFDKSFLAIYHKPEHKLIYMQWKDFATSQQYREGLTHALELVNEHGLEKWLGDLKMMQVILSSDEDWTNEVWYPLIAKSSLRKMAIVTSLDYFNNSAVRRIVTKAESVINFETRYFVDVNEAESWLKNNS
ncbi:MAG: STAS/SEC14 domain-containing protein [Bacteroidetes bacterium]|nr:STAS/SEC14 domain-containing protein [Bacteroidota bacterium]